MTSTDADAVIERLLIHRREELHLGGIAADDLPDGEVLGTIGEGIASAIVVGESIAWLPACSSIDDADGAFVVGRLAWSRESPRGWPIIVAAYIPGDPGALVFGRPVVEGRGSFDLPWPLEDTGSFRLALRLARHVIRPQVPPPRGF